MFPRPGGVSFCIAPPPPSCLGWSSHCTSSRASSAFRARLEVAAANRGSACVSLWPRSVAMAGVLSRDTPDIEVPTAALGWGDTEGREAWGRAWDRAGDSQSFPRGD